jgi:hypothetical protein
MRCLPFRRPLILVAILVLASCAGDGLAVVWDSGKAPAKPESDASSPANFPYLGDAGYVAPDWGDGSSYPFTGDNIDATGFEAGTTVPSSDLDGGPPGAESGIDAIDEGIFGDGAVAPAVDELFNQGTLVQSGGQCVPLMQALLAPFVPAQTPTSELVGVTAMGMVGSWVGIAHSIWRPDWAVVVKFEANGNYLATGYDFAPTSWGTPLAFYYGTDNETDPSCLALRSWRIGGVDGSGNAVYGEIDVPYLYPPAGCALPRWQGQLQSIQLDSTNARLQFVFQGPGIAGITYDLVRACGT